MTQKKNKESKKVFLYMRYSSEMQNYMSIEAQRRANKNFCNGKYQIVGEYIDEAKSATTDDRPQFQQMINDCKNYKGKIYAVVVHKLDRFSRNSMDALFYRALLEKYNIKLISVTEPLEDTPESKMFANFLFAINQYYSENLGREVQKGKIEAAYKGLYLGGTPPYGYDVDEKRHFTVNEIESRAVRLIFDMYIADYSYQQIADYLNSNGFRTKKGNKFNKNSFSSILQNAERYTGVYMYNRAESKYSNGQRNSHHFKADEDIVRIVDGMPRIISDEVYGKAKSKLVTNRANSGAFHSERYYLLNGLMVCGNCGRAFSGNTSKAGRNKTEYPTYRCGGYRDDCNNKALNIKYIDDFVVTKLMEIVFDKRNYTYILEALNRKIEKTAYDNKNKMIKVKNRLVQVETSLNKLTKALLEAENLSAITSKIAELEKEKEKFEKKIAELETYEPVFFKKNDIDDVKAKFKSYLLNKDLLVCRKFIRSYVDRIVVCDDCIEVILKTKDENLKKAA